MNRVTLLYLPGLSRTLVAEAMPWLRARPTRPLRIAFPEQPAVLQATLESGQPPAVHGVFGARRLSDGGNASPAVSWHAALPLPSAALTRVRDDRFLHAWKTAVDSSRDEAGALDGELRAYCSAEQGESVLLVGGPIQREGEHCIDPMELLPGDADWQAEGSILRVATCLSSAERSAALLREGVDRVLHGEALARRAGEHPEAGETIVVASAGWSFVEGGPCSLGECFVSAAGVELESIAVAWPSAIHDLRIAPTLARLLGEEPERFAETPL